MPSLEHNLSMGKPKRRVKDKQHQVTVTVSLQTSPFNPDSKLQPDNCAPVPMLCVPDHHRASSRCPLHWLPNEKPRLSSLPGNRVSRRVQHGSKEEPHR